METNPFICIERMYIKHVAGSVRKLVHTKQDIGSFLCCRGYSLQELCTRFDDEAILSLFHDA